MDLDPNIIITLVLGLLSWIYDRGRRYNYLAERWYNLMSTNDDVPEFFDPNVTKEYDKLFEGELNSKYNQHARMHWAFVDDVIGNDYFFEKWLMPLMPMNFVKLYKDSIKDISKLHYTWLENNKEGFFNGPKFHKILIKEFEMNL